MTLQDALNSLNPQQLSAVNYDGGPCLIVAGAGTSKTKTLTQRYKILHVEAFDFSPHTDHIETFVQLKIK